MIDLPLSVALTLALLYPLPNQAPISANFGDHLFGKTHKGTDLVAPKGTQIKASINGTVKIAGNYGANNSYGQTVIIENNSEKVLHAHLSEILVRPGDVVKANQVVGRVGSTGFSTGDHLHTEYSVFENGVWVMRDPNNFWQNQ